MLYLAKIAALVLMIIFFGDVVLVHDANAISVQGGGGGNGASNGNGGSGSGDGDNGNGSTVQQECRIIYTCPNECIATYGKCTKHEPDCCNILKEGVKPDNIFPLRWWNDVIRHTEEDVPNQLLENYDTDSMSIAPRYFKSYVKKEDSIPSDRTLWFRDEFSPRAFPNAAPEPYVNWWEFDQPHCVGWKDYAFAIGGADRHCMIGGWEEMKLYQARCYTHFGIRCLCDYEQTFKIGSAEEYVLRRAGIAVQKGKSIAGAGGASGIDSDAGHDVVWPLSWRGYVSDPFEPNAPDDPLTGTRDHTGRVLWRFPFGYGMLGSVYAVMEDGLSQALPGTIVIWDTDVYEAAYGDGNRYLHHVAYVEGGRTLAMCQKRCQDADRANQNRTNTPNCTNCAQRIEINDWCQCSGASGSLAPDAVEYVEISEYNFGRFPDMCGVTDRWNIVTRRKLFNPNSTKPDVNAVSPFEHPEFAKEGLASDILGKNPDMSCRDPSLYICYEEAWSDAKIYDPNGVRTNGATNDIRRGGYYPGTENYCIKALDNITYEELKEAPYPGGTDAAVVQAYYQARQEEFDLLGMGPTQLNGYYLALADSDRGCDPPISLRRHPRTISPEVPSMYDQALMCPNTERMTTISQESTAPTPRRCLDGQPCTPGVQALSTLGDTSGTVSILDSSGTPTGPGGPGGPNDCFYSQGEPQDRNWPFQCESAPATDACELKPHEFALTSCRFNYVRPAEIMLDLTTPADNRVMSFVDIIEGLKGRSGEVIGIDDQGDDVVLDGLPWHIADMSFPEDRMPLNKPVCTEPACLENCTGDACDDCENDQCVDPFFCFYDDDWGSCDGYGFRRRTIDKTHPFFTDTRDMANPEQSEYRNHGYSRDFVSDYLYYDENEQFDGFLNPSVNSRATAWLRTMLELPVIEWFKEVQGRTCWMLGDPFCNSAEHADPTSSTIRTIWINDKYKLDDYYPNFVDAAFYRPVDEALDDVVRGYTVAIMVSDEYWRGHVGIVTGINRVQECVNITSSNWLSTTCNVEDYPMQFDESNCFQHYNKTRGFSEMCEARCVPIEEVAWMWNPIMPKCVPAPTNGAGNGGNGSGAGNGAGI